ncbi:FmdB family zinc ribbon protein [Variovorax fucosicus]|uniref:FmdB family zinc ribbon protein n=1 Tax=Variovorax fucosicus TaxID=3053517 RepID=UPI0025767B62|nr:FmdB family zinc ribbon protein [Variovorax sp. J22G47]MDM0056215.1 zinc ribbon domain-containing protein [Variovorax sp. J22G47]
MPIYAYKCSACGFAKDVLRKMSDAPLSVCPNCGTSAFEKQVTAAGFQLKGSGWYVTDFREGGGKKPADAKTADAKTPAANGAGTDAKPATDAGASTVAAPATAPAVAPAASPAPAAKTD